MPLITSILDIIFPPICLSCDCFGNFICPKCQQKMTKLPEFICPHCLKMSSNGVLHPKCKGDVDGLISCWNYELTTQIIIKEIKYRFYYASVSQLATLFLKQRQKSKEFDIFLKSNPIIIPVPLHKKRLRYRGFNQAQLIGRELSKAWDLSMSSKILMRTKFSKPQAELTKQERQKNTQDMFSYNPQLMKLGQKPLKDKNIILVDDVWTTGATAQACAKVLKHIGAKNIWVVTLAR